MQLRNGPPTALCVLGFLPSGEVVAWSANPARALVLRKVALLTMALSCCQCL